MERPPGLLSLRVTDPRLRLIGGFLSDQPSGTAETQCQTGTLEILSARSSSDPGDGAVVSIATDPQPAPGSWILSLPSAPVGPGLVGSPSRTACNGCRPGWSGVRTIQVDPAPAGMVSSQTLGRDVARLVRQLSDDDLLQLQARAARVPGSPRALAFGLVLHRERQRRLGERVQRMEHCLWLSRRRGRCCLLISQGLRRLGWALRQFPARRALGVRPSR